MYPLRFIHRRFMHGLCVDSIASVAETMRDRCGKPYPHAYFAVPATPAGHYPPLARYFLSADDSSVPDRWTPGMGPNFALTFKVLGRSNARVALMLGDHNMNTALTLAGHAADLHYRRAWEIELGMANELHLI
jgi:hypothetical protein